MRGAKGCHKSIYSIERVMIMTFQEIKDHLRKSDFLIFEYKSVCYSIQRKRSFFRSVYLLVDTDNPPQQRHSLEDLFTQVCLHNGTHLCDIENYIQMPSWDDSFWVSYEAIGYSAVIYQEEIYFRYKDMYYWIAHTANGTSHLTDDHGHTQEFNSRRDLFEYARIENKSLKEIWSEVVVC